MTKNLAMLMVIMHNSHPTPFVAVNFSKHTKLNK